MEGPVSIIAILARLSHTPGRAGASIGMALPLRYLFRREQTGQHDEEMPMTTLSSMRPQIHSRIEQQLPRVEGEGGAWDFANVSVGERVITGIAGVLLTVAGLRGRRPNALYLAGGGGLLAMAISGYCPVYQALGINRARDEATAEDFFARGIHVESSRTIDRPAEELYRFWRNFENLPRFMENVESVEVTGDIRSHWKVKAPAGTTVEWDAVIINEEADRLIAWRSVEGADVDNAGSVRFLPAPGGRGTEVRVVIEYIPPAGRVGFAVAKLFRREPKQQIEADLRRFKQLIETGEVPTTEGQSHGTCGSGRGGGAGDHGF
jgi:uncharacterized membrane protein